MEAKLLNKDVGFVRTGQPVAVKLDPFPFNRYGTVPGRVQSISSTSVADEKLGLVYIVRVAMGRSIIERDGTSFALSPGMAAVADIRTARRSILSYLLSPIEQTALAAAREH